MLEFTLAPIDGCDVGIQYDLFGNESIKITKPNCRIVQPTLDDMLREMKGVKSAVHL